VCLVMRCLVHCNRAGVKIQNLVNKLVTRAKENRTRNTQIERVDVLCSLCILRVLRGFSSTHSAKLFNNTVHEQHRLRDFRRLALRPSCLPSCSSWFLFALPQKRAKRIAHGTHRLNGFHTASEFSTHSSFFTSHFSFLISHYSLLTTHYSFLITTANWF